MVIKSILRATCACLVVVSFNSNAALVSRLGGLAYYDDVADLTWLGDANYAQTSGYDSDGLMNWADANAWAAGLTVDGVGGWRLADTLQPDASCHNQISGSRGYYCTGSEMGNLFYNVLGGSSYNSITTTHNANYDLFSHVQSSWYWSATKDAHTPNVAAWFFGMGNGYQGTTSRAGNHYAWAVHDGDVVPPTPEERVAELVSTVIALNLKQGVSNALDSKLDNILRALEDINTNNDGSAVNVLYAFINSVEAQRSNFITDEQATTLIDAANAIIENLSD